MLPLSDLERAAHQIRNTLFAAQGLGSAGFLVAGTIGAIAGAALGGHAAWAGVPTATYQAGQAIAALGWGRLMDPVGRRRTLSLGLVVGACGAGLASASITARSLAPFLFGVLLMGFAQSALQLGRFVSAEVHPPHMRGRALSFVVLGGTVGAILGPLLVGPAGRWGAALGRGELAGPYAASAGLLLLSAMLLFGWLRPEPRDLARLVAAAPEARLEGDRPRPLRAILADPPARLAILAMVSGQAVMVMLMVITSLHMTGHDHSLAGVSFVISSHVFGMYAVSPLTGRLTDRWGRRPVIVVGALVLLASSLSAPLSPRLVPLAVSLFALGLGWNLCYVGGSTLLSDRLQPSERARTQGLSDFVIGSAAAAGGILGGLVFATLGYTVMGWLAAAGSLLPLAAAGVRPFDTPQRPR
jgi:MFS family permease